MEKRSATSTTNTKRNVQTQTIKPSNACNPFNYLIALFNGLSLLPLTIWSHWSAFFIYRDLTIDCTAKSQIIMNFNEEQPETAIQRIRTNVHFLAPFILLSINLIDSGIILASENFRYNRTGMEDLITHHIFPQDFWYPGSVIMHLTMIMSVLVPALFLFKPMFDRKYLIFVYRNAKTGSVKVIQSGRVWKSRDATRFLKFRKNARSVVWFLQTTACSTCIGYWFSGLVINYKGEIRDYIFFVFLPFYIVYTTFGCVYITFYIMLSANYTRIQQNFLVERIASLTEQISKGKHITKRLSSEAVWRRFTQINTEILNFFDQLRAANKFWSHYLSVYFIGHISMEVFLMYAGIFNGSEFSILNRSIFIYFTVEFMLLLIAITDACSAIVRHNIKIYKTNVAFCYAYTRQYKVNLMYHFKMSKMISNYKGTRNGFRLINNYIVDSKMFEIIFFYITVIFMKVFTER